LRQVELFQEIKARYPPKVTSNVCSNCEGRGVVVCDNCQVAHPRLPPSQPRSRLAETTLIDGATYLLRARQGTGLQPRFLERYSADDFMD
jgi:hypothetical protein